MDIKNKPTNINISTITILKVLVVFLFIYIVYLIGDILAMLFVSMLLASAIDPLVDWMQKHKIPRPVGILFIYLVVFSVVGLAVYLIIPPIITQLSELSENFPEYIEKITSSFSVIKNYTLEYGILDNIKEAISSFNTNLEGTTKSVFSTVSGIFGNIVSFFLVLVITFYMASEQGAIKKIVNSIVPTEHQPYILQLMQRMQNKIGLWLRGQLILSLIIFSLIFVGLSVLGMNYALVLALIAGLTEFIPYLGPTLAAIPAVFLALTQSPLLALFVLILYVVVQWVENNIIVPKLMQKVVGLNPIVSIVVLLIGFKLAGVVGAILAIPVATAGSVFLKDLFEKRSREV